MKIHKKYAPIYRDATVLLRPEDRPEGHVRRARPGHAARRASLPERRHDPGRQHAARREPRRDPRRRSTPTRAPTCDPARRRRRRRRPARATAADLRATFKRFEPTNRDLARLTGAARQAPPATSAASIHNFRADRRGARRQGRRSSRSSSTPRTRTSTRSPTRTRNLREALAAAARHARARRTRRCSKADALGQLLGPTLQALRPARARARPGAAATSRPFLEDDDAGHQEPAAAVRARRAADRAATCGRRRATSRRSRRDLTTRFDVLNTLFNARLQPARRGGGLPVLAAWLNHAGAIDLPHPGRARPDPARLIVTVAARARRCSEHRPRATRELGHADRACSTAGADAGRTPVLDAAPNAPPARHATRRRDARSAG